MYRYYKQTINKMSENKMSENKMSENKMSEDKMEEVLSIFDEFVKIYNKQHNTTGSMFESIDTENADITATNDKMEIFYQYMQEHLMLRQKNPSLIDIFHHCDHDIEPVDTYNMYALICDGLPIYVSLSYISLLYAGIDLLKTNWGIVKL